MKIGTDGVLLGAWTSLEHKPYSILDIGAGTGVISLMLAQRSSAELIDALEIDENAYEQCVENFEASPWGDRLFCYHASLKEFTEELATDEADIDETYDLIVSNPPFFDAPLVSEFSTENKEQSATARKKARFQAALSFQDLFNYAAQLLSKQGIFCLIVPFARQEEVIAWGNKNALFLQKLTTVQGNLKSDIKRSLLQFGFQQKEIGKEHLILETARHQYTPEYTELVKDFYLKL